jgi:hypothetical protein
MGLQRRVARSRTACVKQTCRKSCSHERPRSMTAAAIGILVGPFLLGGLVLAAVRPARRYVWVTYVLAILVPILGVWFGLRADERPLEGVTAGCLLLVTTSLLTRIALMSRREGK